MKKDISIIIDSDFNITLVKNKAIYDIKEDDIISQIANEDKEELMQELNKYIKEDK